MSDTWLVKRTPQDTYHEPARKNIVTNSDPRITTMPVLQEVQIVDTLNEWHMQQQVHLQTLTVFGAVHLP
jgi:hypothetical protein